LNEIGVYQIYCKAMQEDGIGDLYKEYERLKKSLEEEGLFAIESKKKIPYMPRIVGVLTSKTGAVIRDIINVSTRRNPNVYIRLFPIPVQGKGAEKKIAEAIRIMNEQKLADVLILARGGGSIEDLWPFNEEIVAREIFDSEIPVISAVGHETDFTIADFVADLRAPTPSAAAELAIPDISEVNRKINLYRDRYRTALKQKIEFMRLRYEKIISSKALKNPIDNINEYYITIDNKIKTMENIVNLKLKDYNTKTVELISKLDAMSPLKTLIRGYCIAEKDSKIIKSVSQLKQGDTINLRLQDGSLKTKIMEV